MSYIFLLLLVFSEVIWHCYCARILAVLPTPSISHMVIYQPILRGLSLRGHQVVAIIADPIKDPSLTNLTEIDIHNISYAIWNQENRLGKTRIEKDSSFQSFRDLSQTLLKICDHELSDPRVTDIINDPNQHFDLVINEWLMYISTFAFGEHFKCPIIGLSSMPLWLTGYESVGGPIHPAYALDFWTLSGVDLSFQERLENVIHWVWFKLYYYWVVLPEHDAVAKKHFGNGLPYIADIERNVSLVLINTNPVFHLSRPFPPTVVEIGGIHVQNLEVEFSKELEEYLDNSKNGVIYFSLGSNVKSCILPKATLDAIVKAFAKLPYNILWKFEEDFDFGPSVTNIKIGKWLPQKRILAHPNTILFITQGGLQSIEESIKHQVPMIGIPFAGDQDHNVDRINRLKIGKRLYLENLDEESLTKTINEVLSTRRFKENIVKLSKVFWDQPTEPLQRAIFWIEYVIRNRGVGNLRSPLVQVPWYQYFLLDIIVFFIAILFLPIILITLFYRKVKCYLAKTKTKRPRPKAKKNN